MCLLCDLYARDDEAALPARAAPVHAVDRPAAAPGAAVQRVPADLSRVGPCAAAAAAFRVDMHTGERRARLAAIPSNRR